ncbi:MAG: hypothetical protein H7Y07_14295 [Pyrinomonadaceae bacterium]|nr:hypothetical protein [Sphingobacteriaceae bacterium]
MKISNEITLFCQAPADISYLLTIYEKEHKSKKISIFVINVENLFRFLSELNLSIERLVFIPYEISTLKSLSEIFKERKRIGNLKSIYFKNIYNQQIYFFSRFEDWLTAAFVKDLAKNNSVIYLDHYDFSADIFKRQKYSIRALILKNIYWLLTGVDFKVEIIEKLPEFQYEKYGIKKQKPELDPGIFFRYGYDLKQIRNNKPAVLIFVSPGNINIYDSNSHDQIQRSIIQSLKQAGWIIVVKGHPRLGIPNNILDLVDIEIPSYVPAEFILIKDVSMCLGIITAAIVHFAKNTIVPTYSLINLFNFNKDDSPYQYKQYLSESSDEKILYFDDFDDFNRVITIKKC